MRGAAPPGRLYGRRKGRPLSAHKTALLNELFPRVRISIPENGQIDPRGLFEKRPGAVWLEVGFGGGEHLAVQAERCPDNGYVGCEPFVNGVAGLLTHIYERKLSNIRIFPDDARLLLDKLSGGCLDGCFVLYPDPWPKKRHAGRRFVNAENLELLARTLKPGAELRLATDVASLAGWMREQVGRSPDFVIVYEGAAPPADWVETRYEKKGIAADRTPCYLIAKRH